jgi:hypothetical protein
MFYLIPGVSQDIGMVLEGIAENRNIVYKSKQICAHVDDTVLVTRNTPTLKKIICIGN